MTADPPFRLKDYQTASLDALRAWLSEAASTGDADTAFYKRTRRPYQPVAALPGVPYACLRVPTGGGKTLIAAHAVGVAADAYLKTDSPTCVWLVPSNAILSQTLRALGNRAHPFRAALAERFGENVRVMGVPEALYARRPDYDGGATVIVATIQSFRVTDTEGRKVYEPNGELMDHFGGLDRAVAVRLELTDSGSVTPSLGNVLRLHRPMVIVDEAHNARTALSFETLSRFAPSLILELTATPAADSNILHHVSAAELKSADMIKLPIVLRGRPDWKEVVGEAKRWLEQLDEHARAEEALTGEFIHPVMLLQAQPNRRDGAPVTVEVLKRALIDDHQVPAEQIAIATGSVWELDGVDLAARSTRVRYIITVQALREGWDCPNAYVLCSVAEQRGATAVEQMLGRIMRLPRARRKLTPELNQAYAFTASNSFQQAADALAEGLVANGFERIEAKALVREAPPLPGLDPTAEVLVSEPIPSGVPLSPIADAVSAATGGRVRLNPETRRLESAQFLSRQDVATLALTLPAAAVAALESLATVFAARPLHAAPSPAPVGFAVPRLCVERNGALELFGREHFLDLPWRLEEADPAALLSHWSAPTPIADEAKLDVSAKGRIEIDFVRELHEQLSLAVGDHGWTLPALVRWLDRRVASVTRPDVTQASTQAFIRRALETLGRQPAMPFERIARLRFRVVDALARTIKTLRDARQREAFDTFLFDPAPFRTAADHALVFDPEAYWPDGQRTYTGNKKFEKHLVPGRLGQMNGEEEACAVALDRHPRVERWVRNLERRPEHAFWLQTSTDRFYPDFVALLTDGRVLAAEYKGSDRTEALDADTQEKALVGRRWADASGGRCLFALIEDRDYGAIDRALT